MIEQYVPGNTLSLEEALQLAEQIEDWSAFYSVPYKAGWKLERHLCGSMRDLKIEIRQNNLIIPPPFTSSYILRIFYKEKHIRDFYGGGIWPFNREIGRFFRGEYKNAKQKEKERRRQKANDLVSEMRSKLISS